MKRNHKANGDALPHLLDPLLDRVRAGKPGVGLAFYDGEHLDSGWPKGAGDYARERGYYLEHLKLADLGEAPAASLVRRQRVGDHLFSVEIDPGDLRDSALQRGGAVALLNIHRDTFRDEGICLLLWVPRSRARRFMDLASNLADYRTVDLDIPGQPGYGSGSGAPVPERGAPKTKHNLPIASLGAAFAGREAEMRRLREMLDQSGSGAIADSLALEGLGGVGKTRLALEYAWAHLGDYDSVFLIRADDPSSGRAGIAALAGPEWLDLPGGAERPEPERLAAALDWFRAHRRWLLIIDNADSEESTEWLRDDILPALRGGHVLITTRYQRWGGSVSVLKLEPLSPDAAAAWLLEATTSGRIARPSDLRDAKAIAGAVGGLALALEQIAAWLNHRGGTLADVLDHLADGEGGPLDWFDPKAIDYPRPVAAVWEETASHLSADEAALIRVLAQLSPQPVPDFLVSGVRLPGDKEPRDLWPLVIRLQDRGVLTARHDRATQLHRLWIELERRRTPAAELRRWLGSAIEWVGEAMPRNPTDVRNWPRIERIAPHAERIIAASAVPLPSSIARGDSESIDSPGCAYLLNQFALFLGAQARFHEAEPLFRRALAISEAAYGENHPTVAIRLNNLAVLHYAKGDYAEAEPLSRRAVEILLKFTRDTGHRHPHLAGDTMNYAGILRKNGKSEAEAADVISDLYGEYGVAEE